MTDMMHDCPVCNGEGQIEEHCNQCDGSGEGLHDGTTCRTCGGDGGMHERCESCGGNGEMETLDYIEYIERLLEFAVKKEHNRRKKYYSMESLLASIKTAIGTGCADLTKIKLEIEEEFSR